MTRFKLFSAALILSAGMATPVFAQAAISEPGAYAFYHPDGDVLHTGIMPSPAPDAYAMVPLAAAGGRVDTTCRAMSPPSAPIATAGSEIIVVAAVARMSARYAGLGADGDVHGSCGSLSSRRAPRDPELRQPVNDRGCTGRPLRLF